MGNLNITYLWLIIAYASASQRMLSVSIAFLTYEGLTCNVHVTYAVIKQAFGEFEIVHIKYEHECKILIIVKPSKRLSSPLK